MAKSEIGKAFESKGKPAPELGESEGSEPDAEVLAMKQFMKASSPEAKAEALKSFLQACGALGYEDEAEDPGMGLGIPDDFSL